MSHQRRHLRPCPETSSAGRGTRRVGSSRTRLWVLPRLRARSNAVPEQREQSVFANALVTSSEGAEISLSNRHLCGVDCFGEPPDAYSVSVLPALAALIDRTASLTALDLSRNRLGDAGALLVAAAIEAHPRLRGVNLAANAIGCEGSRALAGALLRSGSVTTANLLRNHWDEESAAALAAVAAQRAGLRSLCGLGLSGCAISQSESISLAARFLLDN